MVVAINYEPDTGGLPIAQPGAAPGSLVTEPGRLQYGDLLLGADTAAGWRQLAGWRDLPEPSLSDTQRPQAHGAYPGDVYGSSLAVTFTYQLTGTPDAKMRAVQTIELHTRMDGVERPLVVDDGAGPELRMARVVARAVPQDVHFRHGPVECSVQWVCADPRRYSLDAVTVGLSLPTSSGGLAYPLTYPLDYGTATSGAAAVVNDGSESTPVVATFTGPLTNPLLTTRDWRLGFNINLAAGESLTVDTFEGTVLLGGVTDRLYTISAASDPVERCLLAPGETDVSLAAAAGTGNATLTYRHARM